MRELFCNRRHCCLNNTSYVSNKPNYCILNENSVHPAYICTVCAYLPLYVMEKCTQKHSFSYSYRSVSNETFPSTYCKDDHRQSILIHISMIQLEGGEGEGSCSTCD